MALDFFAGCVGGCAGILVGHPLDTIKVHLQTQDFRNPIYRGTFHCFRTILQKESVGGLYRGMSSPLAGVAMINAIVFGVYGNIQRRLSDPDSLSSHFVAGFTAGLAQSVVCSPMELAKTRVQVQRAAVYRGCLHCIMQVARTQGLRGVYRGLGITMVRDAPGMGVYFLSYEMITRTVGSENMTTTQVMVAGGVAGCISWIATFPFDVLKSRLQVDGMYGPAQYSGALDCFRQSAKSEGLGFIVRGLTSTLIRAFPVNAATFAGVTWVFKLAGVGKPEEESGYYMGDERSDIRLSPPLLWGLWGNWENKAPKELFHWRKLMVQPIEGNSFLHQQHKGLTSTFMAAEPLRSTDPPSSTSEFNDSEDDGSGSLLLAAVLQEEVISLVPPGEGPSETRSKDSLKEMYRTSCNHENG